jgi:hypothetical protein
VSHGKVVSVDKNSNMVGQAKPQNAVVYDTPHATGHTQEAFPIQGQSTGKGTDYLHDSTNPQRLAVIIKETKNK